MSENIFGSFISHSLSKVRWKPELMEDSEYFITGSQDEEENVVTLWYFPSIPPNDIDIDSLPLKKSSLLQDGDVTALKFLNNSNFIAATSNGTVNLLECSDSKLNLKTSWTDLHYWKSGDAASCTDVTTFEEDVATVGYDGRIVLLNINQLKPLRVIDRADSCQLQCVCFLKHNELVTGNLRGQLKIWDLRSNDNTPMSNFMSAADGGCTMCVINHPSQKHLMLAGGEDGAVTVWDLRKSTFPVNVLNAHRTAVMEMMFHPERPEYLFTCSFGGDLWQWNSSRNVREHGGEETAWLSSDATKHRMEVASLMTPMSKSINSLDVNQTSLICGCSNEAVYFIQKLLS